MTKTAIDLAREVQAKAHSSNVREPVQWGGNGVVTSGENILFLADMNPVRGPFFEDIDFICAALDTSPTIATALLSVQERLDKACELLKEAAPYLEAGEYLLNRCSYYYGRGSSEPSPAEWGVSAEYYETKEAGPRDQFDQDVESWLEANAGEADPLTGEYLCVANRARAFLEQSQ